MLMESLKDINSRDEEFKKIGQSLLTDFQYIELILRRYITCCYNIIKSNAPTVLNYGRDPKLLDKFSLGKLVNEAKVFCKNQKLINGIESFINERNRIAHSLFISAHESAYDKEFVESEIESMKKIKTMTEHFIVLLLEEERKIKNPNRVKGKF
jgi:hypothetical protein